MDAPHNTFGAQNDFDTVPELGGGHPSGGIDLFYLRHPARQRGADRIDVFSLRRASSLTLDAS